jgi:hypothetical protein
MDRTLISQTIHSNRSNFFGVTSTLSTSLNMDFLQVEANAERSDIRVLRVCSGYKANHRLGFGHSVCVVIGLCACSLEFGLLNAYGLCACSLEFGLLNAYGLCACSLEFDFA